MGALDNLLAKEQRYAPAQQNNSAGALSRLLEKESANATRQPSLRQSGNLANPALLGVELMKQQKQNFLESGEWIPSLTESAKKVEDEIPVSLGDRITSAISGAGKQYAGSITNTVGTMRQGAQTPGQQTSEQRTKDISANIAAIQKNLDDINAGVDIRTEGEKKRGVTLDEVKAELEEQLTYYNKQGNIWNAANEIERESGKMTQSFADSITQSGAKDIEKAKKGLGFGGQLAVDALVGGTTLAADYLTGAAPVALATRAFGSATQEARQAGATQAQQAAYGIAVAAVEFLTEKLFDGVAKIYGAGAADDIVENVIAKLAKSDNGRTVLRTLASGFGEGSEELISGAINPALQSIYNGKTFLENYSDVEAADILYDGLVGGVLGLAGGSVGIVTGENAAKNREVRTFNSPTQLNNAPRATQTQQGNLPGAEQNGAGTKNTAPTNGAANSEIKDYQRQEKHGKILDVIRNNIDKVSQMPPVKGLSGNEFQKTEGDSRSLRAKVIEFFNSIGNKVFRPGMGEIELGVAGARDSTAHGYGKLKAATFAALPEVLTNGELVETHGPYEGHNYDSHFIVAPVTVGGEMCYVGAIVIKDDKTQRYKLHEVLTTNKNGVPLFQSESDTNAGPLRSDTPPEGPLDLPLIDSNIANNNEEVNSGRVPTSVGAMDNPFPTETKRTRAESNTLNAVEGDVPADVRAEINYNTVSEAESVSRAEQRLEVDFDGEVEYLRSKTDWSGEDFDTAMLIRAQLEADAKESGDWSAYSDWRKIIADHGSEIGRALQSLAKYSRDSGAAIIEEANEILDESPDADDNAIMNEVSELAGEYDAAVEAEDLQSLVDIIRRTSKRRRTGTFFKNKLSFEQEWALRRCVENGDVNFLKAHAAAGIVNIARDTLKIDKAEAVKTFRRNAMLSKASTILRNLVSNNIFDPTDTIARDISVPLDMLLSKFTGTRSVAVDKSWFSAAKRKGSLDGLAKSILEVGLDVDATGNASKYENTSTRTFRMQGNVVERLLSSWEKWMGYALTSTDAFQKGGIEAEVLRGLQELVDSGKMTKEQAEGRALNALSAESLSAPVKNGTVVKALDRNNYGKVVQYFPATNSYSVHFVSPDGKTATVTLPANQIVPTAHSSIKDAQKAGRKQSNQSPEQSIAEMAAEVAKYRTFQDENAATKAALGVRKALDNIEVGGVGLGTVAVPFAQVPTNLAVRAAEYSPVGLANSIRELTGVLKSAKNGTLTAAQQAKAVQDFGRGISGTALIAAATALAAKGVLEVLDTGSEDKDKDGEAIKKMTGQTGTQLNLDATLRWLDGESTEWRDGDTLISIGFLEPLNAQLTTGALIAEGMAEDEEYGVGDALLDSAEGTLQSVLDMPVMSELKNVSNAYQYSKAETVGGKALDAAAQFAADIPASFIPNAVKGIAQGTDKYQRDLYSSENIVGQMGDSIMASIPGLRNNVPAKQDSYGRPVETGNAILNFLNNNILPGSVTEYSIDEITDTILELNATTGNDGVFPNRKAANSVTFDGTKFELSPEDKRQYQQTQGTTFAEIADVFMGGEKFADLSDAEKAEIFSDIVAYSAAKARQEFLEGQGKAYKLTGEARTVEKALDTDATGVDFSEYFVLKNEHDKINDKDITAVQKATEFAKYLDDLGWLNDNQVSKVEGVLTFSTGLPAEAEKYRDLTATDLSSDNSKKVFDAVSALEPRFGEELVSANQKYSAIINLNMSESDTRKALTVYDTAGKGNKSKMQTAFSYNVPANVYVQMLNLKEQALDVKNAQRAKEGKNATSSLKDSEWKSIIASTGADKKIQDILYAIATDAKNVTWVYVK